MPRLSVIVPVYNAAPFLRNCHAAGVAINVWTVNDMLTLEKLHAWNCEGVITNFPGVAKAWLNSVEHA